jgi:hypothetical protein
MKSNVRAGGLIGKTGTGEPPIMGAAQPPSLQWPRPAGARATHARATQVTIRWYAFMLWLPPQVVGALDATPEAGAKARSLLASWSASNPGPISTVSTEIHCRGARWTKAKRQTPATPVSQRNRAEAQQTGSQQEPAA